MSPINFLTDDENINLLLLDIYNSVKKRENNENTVNHILQKIDFILNIDNSKKVIITLLVLIMAIRDKKGDKGYKYISRKMYLYLYKSYPQLIKISLSSYIEVGYYKDINFIIADLYDDGYNDNDDLIITCYQLYANEFIRDYKNYSNNQPVSLCVKYIPKPSNKWQKKYRMVNQLVKYIYPNINNKIKAKNKYRKEYVKLNKYNLITETIMSRNKWNNINFENVPVKCQVQNIMAFSIKCPDTFNNYIENKIYTNNENMNFIDIVDKIINYNFDKKLCIELEENWNKCKKKYIINLETYIISLDLEKLYNRDIAIILMLLELSYEQNNIFGGKLLLNDTVYNLYEDNLSFCEKIKFIHNLILGTSKRSLISTITSYSDKNKFDYNSIPNNVLVISDKKYTECVPPKAYNILSKYDLVNNKEYYYIKNVTCWNIRENKIKTEFKTRNRFDLKINENYISGKGKLFIDFILMNNNSLFSNFYPNYLDYLFKENYKNIYLILDIAYTIINKNKNNCDLDDNLNTKMNWADYSSDTDEESKYNLATDTIENTPPDTLESPIENTPSDTLESPIENTPSDTLESPIENTPSDTLESPIENTPSDTQESPIENTPPLDTLESPIENTPSDTLESPIENTPSDTLESPIENTPSDTLESPIENTPPLDTQESLINNIEYTLEQMDIDKPMDTLDDSINIIEDPQVKESINTTENEQKIENIKNLEELTQEKSNDVSWYYYFFNKQRKVKIGLKYNDDYCIINKE
jgi:hypothetical protein